MLDNYLEELQIAGVSKISNVFTKDTIELLRTRYLESWKSIKLNWPTTWYKRQYLDMNRKYDNYIGTDLYNGRKIAYYRDTMIIDMGLNRYDFTFGLDSINLQLPDILTKIIDKLLGSDYDYYLGGLPIESQTEFNGKPNNGYWHRDAYSLFNDETIDLSLPPFYYTILIPFDNINSCNGGTEFISGSHKINLSALNITNTEQFNLWIDQLDRSQFITPELNIGDIVIFNGYTIHRGLFNKFIHSRRDMLYIVVKKTWYNDEPSANYLDTVI